MNLRSAVVVGVLCVPSLIFAGCSGSSTPAPATPLTVAAANGVGQSAIPSKKVKRKIQHVIFIVQENRSFNYMFMGFPGANTQNYGYDTNGNKIMLHSQTMKTSWDINHGLTEFLQDFDNGKLDGWNKQYACCGSIPSNFAYAYAPQSEVATYWKMAKQYVLADNLFQSNLDGSFVAHQYIIAGYSQSAVNYPSTYWGCPGGKQDQVPTITQSRGIGPAEVPCFDYPTIGDSADTAGISWRFYSGVYGGDGGLWQSYQAINHIYKGPDWTADNITPPAQFLTDVQNGTLANITWVMPTYANSDHPGFESSTGPAWVASVVNAVGQSPFWKDSAIFLIWDDWGGWFDPVAPVYEDYDGTGFRIPAVIISPYAKKGYVSHIQYETSSVLRFMEDNFALPQLAASDARAADPANDAFDFTQKPRKFKAFGGSQPASYWLSRPPKRLPPGMPRGGD